MKDQTSKSVISKARVKNFFITIPHSGEKIPELTPWLKNLPEEVVMCDVDRFVDRLYEPALHSLQLPSIKTDWHRYAVDLNRIPEDIDATSVVGSSNPPGMHNRGFHWVETTYSQQLLPNPLTKEVHQQLTQLIYEPFHQKIRDIVTSIRESGTALIYHIDAHSMPSLGTKMHRDPGEVRADIVVSDCSGKSCSTSFRDLVIAAYCTAGFKVAYNWPYLGGRVTEQYGHPEVGHHAIQVEMNRQLYMDEKTKKLKPASSEIQQKVLRALGYISENLPQK